MSGLLNEMKWTEVLFPFLSEERLLHLQVQKHGKEPFLMSGCKVADGSGTMLVNVYLFLGFSPFQSFRIAISPMLFLGLCVCVYVLSIHFKSFDSLIWHFLGIMNLNHVHY